MKEKINVIKYSSIFLLMSMVITLILTFILFTSNISITKLNIIISLIISSITLFLLNKKLKLILTNQTLIKSIILSILILIISITSMTFIYDRSSDGNTYHKDAIGNLYLGWNPVYESSAEFLKDNFKVEDYNTNSYDIWKDHYAKANWVLEANVYKLTDNIESGKAVNLIFMYILFAFSFTFFIDKLNVKKSLIMSMIITFNPITCNQLFTFYNDQLGTSLLFMLILNLIDIVSNNKENIILKFITLFSTFLIIVNIKFNIMGYALIFTFIFMLKFLYIKYKENKFKDTFKKLFISYIILFILSFGLIGYSTYIKNFIDHGNMFYPVYGKNCEDIITKQQPSDFIEKNVLEKFFIGTFSKVNNLQESKEYELKIPFTFTKDEVIDSMSVDTRLSGFGIFSSGLFILSIIGIIIYLKKKDKKEEKANIITLLSISVLLILIISESWWARYTPTNYLFIIILAYLLLKYNKKKLINIFIITIILINSFIILLGNSYYSVTQSININKDLSKLKNKEINISFNLGDMTGILYNLNDKNIKYNYIDKELDNITYYKYLNYEIKEVEDEK